MKNYNLRNSKLKCFIPAIISWIVLSVMMVFLIKVEDVHASKPLDEILLYSITADVQEDATVDLTYEIAWKVLDSSSEGPLEWVNVGIPNSHYNSIEGLSDTIKSISVKNSGGTNAVIYFDRKYYKDEVVNFSFKVNMDYMYQVYPEENIVEYGFTPGWFDSIAVDQLLIRWNSDKISKFEPAGCLMDGGYHVWTASLEPGEKFSVEISYPIDAYGFDLSKHEEDSGSSYDFSEHSLTENILFSIMVVVFIIFAVILCAAPILIPIAIVYVIYRAMTGFNVTKTKQITRTIIEYYPSCPNCGGSREEGKEKCSYCGTNMIKEKQVVKEEDASKLDKSILEYKSNGEYRFSDNPNRYVRVNVITVPHVVRTTPTTSSRSSGSRSSGGRSHHSSCAHSSCACACACACAGGGRAGCSTKDFYNTNLKLKYLKTGKKNRLNNKYKDLL